MTASVEEPLGQLGYVPFRLGWLAPATMALLLSCVLFNQHSGSSFFGPGNSVLMVEAAMSNQGAATWLPGSFHREQNNAASFRWTTAAGWTSSISSLSGARGSD